MCCVVFDLKMGGNFIAQVEEVQALASIYGDDWVTESEDTRSYSVKIEANKRMVTLNVTMPPDYPSLTPPQYELSAPWMDRVAKVQLHRTLDDVYLHHIGETVVFQWVEAIREVLLRIKSEKKSKKNSRNIVQTEVNDKMKVRCPDITHGEVIIDRKSCFQGHAAEVHSIEEVHAVLAKLKQNKKISNAKHNIYAYRFEERTSKGLNLHQDADDDGEAQASGRLLHLLQILDQKSTLVVVTRWFGGVLLGPDRFRHINNASRIALQQAGMLKKR